MRYSVNLVEEEKMRIFFAQHEKLILEMNLKLIAVKEATPQYKTEHDGFLGLKPLKSAGDKKKWTFLQQLRDQGKIDHYVFSLYIREHKNNYSSVKFGSYDTKGIQNGGKLAIYRTRENTDWDLTVNSFSVNKAAPLNRERRFQFEFGLPYLYLPEEEFSEFIERMTTWDFNLRCDANGCHYN